MQSDKPLYLSRTFWVNVIALAALFIPYLGEELKGHPETSLGILALINLIIRICTKGTQQLSDSGHTENTAGGGVSDPNLPAASGPLQGGQDLQGGQNHFTLASGSDMEYSAYSGDDKKEVRL